MRKGRVNIVNPNRNVEKLKKVLGRLKKALGQQKYRLALAALPTIVSVAMLFHVPQPKVERPKPAVEVLIPKSKLKKSVRFSSIKDPILRRKLEKHVENIIEVAKEVGLDPALALALVHVESSFNPNARSKAGAIGLTQTMPVLVKEMNRLKRLGLVKFAPSSVAELYDPVINLRTGLEYLKYLMDRDLSLYDALRAYNCGLKNVKKSKKAGQDYALKILRWKRFYDKIIKGKLR